MQSPRNEYDSPNGWSIPQIHDEKILSLSRELGTDPVWARMLLGRGFDGGSAKRAFTSPLPPGEESLGDFTLAFQILCHVLETASPIAVYADLDVDGVTSATMFSRFLRRRKHPYITLLVHRNDGHGLKRERLLALVAKGFRYLLVADMGTSDISLLEEMKSLGLTTIVVDHHLLREEWPANLALVHPRGRSCLTAVGSLYVLLAPFFQNDEEREMAFLAGLAVLADRAPLLDGNRYFIRALRDQASLEAFPGIRSLLRRRLQRRVMVNDYSFLVIPAINAPGRMSDPYPAFELLMATSEVEGERLAQIVLEINRHRQETEWSLYEEIRKVWDGCPVVFQPGWAPGIMGRIAHRLCEEFNVSVFVGTLTKDGAVRGSLRLRGGDTLDTVLKCLEGLPIQGGGHAKAGGLGFPVEILDMVRRKLSSQLNKKEEPSYGLNSDLEIDAFLPAYYRSTSFWEGLGALLPFGEGFQPPKLGVRNALIERIEDGRGRTVLCHFRWKHGLERAAIRSGLQVPHSGERVDLVMTPELVGKGDRVERHFSICSYRIHE
ncbi:DHH family phosphoesterase [Leptospirillum ferrooxidans]|jgi:single-stranded-DNA-specific exonuclease|uniref:Putative RecJ exonuclease n=1 Tax=Leptospirillum ferrooxidans (strain C2-3) TaxID=1162668 RepID=I0INQ6_LEPFC|nr:DHH family phosphoesterase [Leptospirillum ferrooxidans]BAM06905.1 putative RecJ exonuclease [Leptospirillum ferrooxidans C2-3]